MDAVIIALAIVALVLAGINIFRSQGQDLDAWAVLALGAAFLLTRIPT